MHINVEITVCEGDQVVDRRVGHNVWVDGGREYLARTIALLSPITGTPPGSVDLVANFPELTNEFFYLRVGHPTGSVEYRVQLASPLHSGQLLGQINAQIDGATASLGGGNGIVFTPAAPTGIEIVGGSALVKLGLAPTVVPPSGMTTTPIDTRRVKYMGFGIGSTLQNTLIAANPPLSTSYPPGSDPNATSGNEYDKLFPKAPLISSLERPVRISGGINPYPGDPGDVWLVQSPKFSSFISGVGVIKFHGVVDAAGGDMLYGPFTQMPLSEVGLFLSGSNVNDAFNAGKLVAYYSFGTILLTVGLRMELIWTVSF